MDFLASFHTHYGAMKFHRWCKNHGIPAKMSPVPREISSSCGVCVRFSADKPPATHEHEDIEQCYSISGDAKYTPVI